MKRSIDPLRYHSSRALNAVSPQPLHRALGLTDGEHGRIHELLGREPNDFELAVFSLLWSEHCGYKHSRPLLGRFPTSGARVLQGPGENAGVIDVGDGLAVALKVESHNHPSAVEPFQGAATGVGGILRDIFAMGARPIAILDSLRFGELDDDRQRHLFSRVVAGVGHYGNCVGVAKVGGEVEFEPAYEHNCLVNAMCVGLLPADRLTSARATGVGNLVVLYGSRTGRDGIGGASVLASQGFDEDSADKRPSVQIGDPFTGKKLIECTLELLDRGLLAALQDLGAAGLASSTAEMAASGGVGIDLDLARVPLREPDMEPFEIMISESQERMAAVVEPRDWWAAVEDAPRWEVDATVIGEVTDSGHLRCFHADARWATSRSSALADGAPATRWSARARPGWCDEPLAFAPVDDAPAALRALLASPNIASRRLDLPQYDQLVGSGTVVRPGGDAGVVRLTPVAAGDRGLARRQRPAHLARPAPRRHERRLRGGAQRRLHRRPARRRSRTASTSETRRPARSATSWPRRSRAWRWPARRSACRSSRATSRSTTSTSARPIHPHARGRRGGRAGRCRAGRRRRLRRSGDVVLLAGDGPSALDGSEYQKRVLGAAGGRIPEPDLVNERRLHEFLAAAAERRLLQSAHDVADGGLAVALAESAIIGRHRRVCAGAAIRSARATAGVVIGPPRARGGSCDELAGALALRRARHRRRRRAGRDRRRRYCR